DAAPRGLRGDARDHHGDHPPADAEASGRRNAESLLRGRAGRGTCGCALVGRRVVPSTLELMDRDSLDTVAAYVGERLAPDGTGALLLIEVDGMREAVESEADAVGAACRDVGALEVLRARSDEEREALWRVRRETSYALRTIAPLKLNNDVVV